ncbi:DotA/TraY family protein [Paracoccus litorisediminis]|uniref:DotA/TraY family protein n=1 Tax=Paracoccus litorisediminis TaxID=2006130 RepID=UPI00372F3B61
MAGLAVLSGLVMASAAIAQGMPDFGPEDAFSFFGTVTGDAYSSNFLHQIFGPLFPAASGGVTVTVFSSIIGYFNVCVVVVGGLMLFYNITVGVLQTAHEGAVLGQRTSSLWAPLRVLFAIGLLVPLPGLQGYNVAQNGVAFVTRAATMMGSFFWTKAATLVIDGKVAITVPSAEMDPTVMKTIFMNEVCTYITNRQFEIAGGSFRIGTRQTHGETPVGYGEAVVWVPNGRITHQTYLQDISRNPSPVTEAGICGSVTTPELPEYIRSTNAARPDTPATIGLAPGNSEATQEAFQRAHADSMNSLKSGFQTIIRNNFAAMADTGAGIPDLTAELSAAIRESNRVLGEGIQLTTRAAAGANMDGQASRDALLVRITGNCADAGAGNAPAACYGEGWIGAGSWYMMIARMNNEIASLARAKSEAAAANYLSPRSIYRRSGGSNGVLSWMWGGEQNATSAGLLSSEELSVLKERYEEAFTNAGSGMAALGFTMGNRGLAELNSETDSDSFFSSIPRYTRTTTYLVNLIVAKASPSDWGADPMVGLTNIGHFMVHLAGVMATVALVAGSGILGFTMPSGIATVLIGPITIMMGAGSTLAFILPMTPSILWIMAVTGYFLLVIEAVVAVNLWGLAHLRMDGDGISGEAGRQGWLMILALFFTPSLMIFGFIAGMTLFRVTSALFDLTISQSLSGVLGGSPFMVVGAILIFSIMMAAVYMMIVERSFSLVSEFPNRVMQWMGAHVSIGADADTAKKAAAAGAISAAGGSGYLTRNGMAGANSYSQYRSNKKSKAGDGGTPTASAPKKEEPQPSA